MRYEKSMLWIGVIAAGAVLLGSGSAFAEHRSGPERTSVGGQVVLSTGQVSVVIGGQYHRPAPRWIEPVCRPAPVVVYRPAPAPVCRPVYVAPRCAPPRPVVIYRYDRDRHDRHWRHDRGRGHDHDRGRGDRGRDHRRH